MMYILDGKGRPKDAPATLAAWQTLFLVVPRWHRFSAPTTGYLNIAASRSAPSAVSARRSTE
jgi:hypothetical protein